MHDVRSYENPNERDCHACALTPATHQVAFENPGNGLYEWRPYCRTCAGQVALTDLDLAHDLNRASGRTEEVLWTVQRIAAAGLMHTVIELDRLAAARHAALVSTARATA